MGEEITELARVDKLKALLGITDDGRDILVEFALENAEEIIKNYCHIDKIPLELSTAALRMAADIYRNEQLGKEEIPQSVSSVTVGDTSTSFQTSSQEFSESILKNYTAVLKRHRKVVFHEHGENGD